MALHIAQTANEHLDLLGRWLANQSQEIYGACHLAPASAARAAAFERTGRTLRRILDAEALADELVAGVDLNEMAWGNRYRSARASARATRARIALYTQRIHACENPLGIADSDLPMFYQIQALHQV